MSEPTEAPEDPTLLLSLATAKPETYTDLDKYRDFRMVFLANDQGQRVLRELLAHCHMFKTSFDKDSGALAFKEGERNVALWLMSIISNEPKPRPTQANRVRPNE